MPYDADDCSFRLHQAVVFSPPMSRRLSRQEWEQLKAAYAAGAGLRELARNMGIPAGTVLARAKREGWTQQIAQAKLIERPELAQEIARPDAINAITPMQSAAITMQQRGRRYAERMAGVSEKVVPHLESMEPGDILESARNIEQLDRVARRTYGLDDQKPTSSVINLELLTGQALVQVINPPA